MSRDVISDEAWAVIGSLFPSARSTGRPPVDRRTVVEATAWRFRTGAPWRDVPERFGNWSTIYKNFNRWAEQGVWARVLEKTQSLAQQSGDLDWVASIDSTIVRVDTIMLGEIRVPGARGRPRSRPDRVLADKGYPSKANRA